MDTSSTRSQMSLTPEMLSAIGSSKASPSGKKSLFNPKSQLTTMPESAHEMIGSSVPPASKLFSSAYSPVTTLASKNGMSSLPRSKVTLNMVREIKELVSIGHTSAAGSNSRQSSLQPLLAMVIVLQVVTAQVDSSSVQSPAAVSIDSS